MESLSIETVIALLIWIDKQCWGINENGLWNNIYNSGGESGIDNEAMIKFFLTDYLDHEYK